MDKSRWYLSWVLGATAGVISVSYHLPWWGAVLNGLGFATVASAIEHFRSDEQNRRSWR